MYNYVLKGQKYKYPIKLQLEILSKFLLESLVGSDLILI